MYKPCFLLFCVVSSFASAGGFDNSGRPFDVIFGDDNSLQLNLKYILPLVELKVHREQGQGSDLVDVKVEDVVSSYVDAMAGIRVHLGEGLNCALQWELPFRFQTRYPDDRLSYQSDVANTGTQVSAPLNSEYRSQSVTLACMIGISFSHAADSFSMSRLSLIAGPKYQTIEGRFSSDLTSLDLAGLDNYSARLQGSDEWAYILGLAYEIPEWAFRLSIFFHNEVEHDLKGEATAPLADLSGSLTHPLKGRTVTPKSLHLNFQTGITENWLAFLNLRWGDWSNVDEIWVDAGPLSQRLSMFSHDTLNYEFGLAVRLSPRLNLGGQFASFVDLDAPDLPDGLAGTNLRNPQADRYSFGVGGQYLISPALKLGMSASYYFLEHGRFSDNAYTVKLETSHAFVFSGTLQYSF